MKCSNLKEVPILMSCCPPFFFLRSLISSSFFFTEMLNPHIVKLYDFPICIDDSHFMEVRFVFINSYFSVPLLFLNDGLANNFIHFVPISLL
jgi:hypothetical protein